MKKTNMSTTVKVPILKGFIPYLLEYRGVPIVIDEDPSIEENVKNVYYEAPTDEQFEEVKAKCIQIWNTYDDTYGYATEEIDRIKNMENISDNVMYMIAMFDMSNMTKLSILLSVETRKAISDRMISGGNPPEYNPFLI